MINIYKLNNLLKITLKLYSNKNIIYYNFSSKAWLQRHINDNYVKLAMKDNVRSRSAYKLLEIQEKYKIIKANDFIIDLGSTPGGWSLITMKTLNLNNNGMLISIDLLPMEPIPDVHFIKGDFRNTLIQDEMNIISNKRKANVILSDMLMNTTGDSSTDHYRSMNICYEVLEFANKYLKHNGHLLCKYYQGSDEKELITIAKQQFSHVKSIKPKSSRTDSKEMYLFASNKLINNINQE